MNSRASLTFDRLKEFPSNLIQSESLKKTKDGRTNEKETGENSKECQKDSNSNIQTICNTASQQQPKEIQSIINDSLKRLATIKKLSFQSNRPLEEEKK